MAHKNFPADQNFIISSINSKGIVSFQSNFIALWSANEEFMKEI